MAKDIFMLGRQPALGIAELERLIGHESIEVFSEGSVVSTFVVDKSLMSRLGGTQKIGEVIAEAEIKQWKDIENFIKSDVLSKIAGSTEGKINLGVSCYGIDVQLETLNKSTIALKKLLKESGRPVRVVPNRTETLSTAQVLHNQLTDRHGFELLVVAGKNKVIFAKTVFIQDIEGYAARDQARPKRDARVGMLPPKLAQIMINLANPAPNSWVLDPFCGTGVILQEALLMGFNTYGTDLDKRMVEYSETNLNWLSDKFSNLPKWQVETADATSFSWNLEVNSVVSETYLGRPLTFLPPLDELKKDAELVSKLIEKFLINLHKQLNAGAEICIAVPAWHTQSGFLTLPLLDHIERIGYNRLSFKCVDTSDLMYFRPSQLVVRQLLTLVRK